MFMFPDKAALRMDEGNTADVRYLEYGRALISLDHFSGL